MNEIDVFSKLEEITAVTQFGEVFGDDTEKAKQIADHKNWLRNIRHERPNVTHPFKVGVYIRYFNQTKYENYLSYHKKQFQDSIALCPKWEFVDFYVDNGASPPYMENAPAWSSLMEDCMSGNSIEIYSKFFIDKLNELVPDLSDGNCYHMTGSIVPSERMAVFSFKTLQSFQEGESVCQ